MEEPIILGVPTSAELSLTEKIKSIAKKIHLDALEFFTDEPLSNEIGHCYTISKLSIVGTPSYINGRLKELCLQFKNDLINYSKEQYSYEEKMLQYDEIQYTINNFIYENKYYSHFFEGQHNCFVLHIQNKKRIEVTLNQISMKSDHLREINDHLDVRMKHFHLLDNFVSLLKRQLTINVSRSEIDNPMGDEKNALALLEIWIALKNLGFLNFIKPEDEVTMIPMLRNKFFQIFQQSDINYRKLRSKLFERKNTGPHFLQTLKPAFEISLKKKFD